MVAIHLAASELRILQFRLQVRLAQKLLRRLLVAPKIGQKELTPSISLGPNGNQEIEQNRGIPGSMATGFSVLEKPSEFATNLEPDAAVGPETHHEFRFP